MRNQWVSLAAVGALGLAAASQTHAQGDDLAALKAQLEALQAKVAELQKQQDRATDAVAQTKASTGEWVSRFTWKGDLRYRHENIDQEGAVSDRDRQRVRARFGLSAKVNDSVTGVVQLATQGDDRDPRSTNQTLGEGWSRKGVGIDLAYLDWKATEGLNLQLGKMPQPWQKVSSYFWDNDITPEGGALKFARGAFFASAFGYWLSERSTANDATLVGAQLGFKSPVGPAQLTGAVGYFDVGAVQGQQTALDPDCPVALNTTFFGGAQGNTTVSDGDCRFLANDFNMVQALLQADMKVGALPLTLFADYLQNQEVDDLDTGVSFGLTLGKAVNPGTWELGYIYQSTEKDAQFGQFMDSDFAGGVTDADGSAFKVGYAFGKNWLLNGTYFLNARNVDVGDEFDYDRYQIDLNYKF